jgi:hypothetical protein
LTRLRKNSRILCVLEASDKRRERARAEKEKKRGEGEKREERKRRQLKLDQVRGGYIL